MATVSTNEFKGGLKIMLDGAPCSIIENEFVKPGKGRAINRVKYRNLLTGRVLEKTFTSGDSLPMADVTELNVQFLYNDGEHWHFMCSETFEQYSAGGAIVPDCKLWLKEQDECIATLWDGSLINVAVPKFVDLLITQTDPGVKGDTVSGATKPATLETGTVVHVPLFIGEGEKIRVDTRTGKYDSRVKD